MKHSRHDQGPPPDTFHVITDAVDSSLSSRRRRYLCLMAVRVLLVPGVFLVDLPVGVQVAVILGAALSQLVAVVDANTPVRSTAMNPNLYTKAQDLVAYQSRVRSDSRRRDPRRSDTGTGLDDEVLP
jgi:hypothetical protein